MAWGREAGRVDFREEGQEVRSSVDDELCRFYRFGEGLPPSLFLSMTIRLLFFASYRDLLGVREQLLEVAGALTVGQMIAELRRRDDGFSRLPQSPAVAVNEEYAAADRVLQDGDVVAFIPPVAGG